MIDDDDESRYSTLLSITSSWVLNSEEHSEGGTSSGPPESQAALKRKSVIVETDGNNNNKKIKVQETPRPGKSIQEAPRARATSSFTHEVPDAYVMLYKSSGAPESNRKAPGSLTTSSEAPKAPGSTKKAPRARATSSFTHEVPDASVMFAAAPRADPALYEKLESPDASATTPKAVESSELLPEESEENEEIHIINEASPESQPTSSALMPSEFQGSTSHTNTYTPLAREFLQLNVPITRGANCLLESFSLQRPYLRIDKGLYVTRNLIRTSQMVLEVTGAFSMSSEVQQNHGLGFLYSGCELTTDAARIVHIASNNESRSIRKSCLPNVMLRHVVSKIGRIRIFVVSTKLIRVGVEIMLPLDGVEFELCALHEHQCPELQKMLEKQKKVQTASEEDSDEIQVIRHIPAGKGSSTSSKKSEVSEKSDAPKTTSVMVYEPSPVKEYKYVFQKQRLTPMSPTPESDPEDLVILEASDTILDPQGQTSHSEELNVYSKSAFEFISRLQEPPESDEILKSFDAAIAVKKVCRLVGSEADTDVLMSAKTIDSEEIITELVGQVEMAGEVEDSGVGFKYSGLGGPEDIWITPINATRSIRRSCKPNAVLNHTISASGGIRILVIALAPIGKYQEVTLSFSEGDIENLDPRRGCKIQGCAIHEVTATREEGKAASRNGKSLAWKEFLKRSSTMPEASPLDCDAPEDSSSSSEVLNSTGGSVPKFEPSQVPPSSSEGSEDSTTSSEAPGGCSLESEQFEASTPSYTVPEASAALSTSLEAPERYTRKLESSQLSQPSSEVSGMSKALLASSEVSPTDFDAPSEGSRGSTRKLEPFEAVPPTSTDPEVSATLLPSSNAPGAHSRKLEPFEAAPPSSGVSEVFEAPRIYTRKSEPVEEARSESVPMDFDAPEAPLTLSELLNPVGASQPDALILSQLQELTKAASSSIILMDHDYSLNNDYSPTVTRVLSALPSRAPGPESLLEGRDNKKASEFSFLEDTTSGIVTILRSTSSIKKGEVILEMRGHVAMPGEKEESVKSEQGRYYFSIHWMPIRAIKEAFGDHTYPKSVLSLEPENDVKFLRRSCQPNAVFQHAFDTNHALLILLVATREIPEDQEISVAFDSEWSPSDTPRWCSVHGADKRKCDMAKRKRRSSKEHTCTKENLEHKCTCGSCREKESIEKLLALALAE